MPWLMLLLAIASELSGTLAMRHAATAGIWPAVWVIVVSYAASFGFMMLALRHLNVAVVYAVWSAAGTAAIAVAGALLFGDSLNARGIAGLVIIVVGVCVLVASGSAGHG